MGKIYDTLVRSRRELKKFPQEDKLFNDLFLKKREQERQAPPHPEEAKQKAVQQQERPVASVRSTALTGYQVPAHESGIDQRMLVYYEPRSGVAEQFRIIRARLRRFAQDKQHKTLLVSSTKPQEGKSFVAANLAISIAQEAKSPVLLIDGDLRKPSVHKLFGLSAVRGFADYLMGEASLEEITRATEIEGLYLLPAGAPPANPAELISSQLLKSMLDEVKTKYGECWIIFDSTPIESTPEPTILIEHADGCIFVVQADSADRKLIKDAVGELDGNKILGVVFNRANYHLTPYYYYPQKVK